MSPCWPAAEASLGTAVMIFPGVPVVITFVVRIVIGVFMPALLVTPARTRACNAWNESSSDYEKEML